MHCGKLVTRRLSACFPPYHKSLPMFSGSNQTCICGRFFDNAGAFTRHKKSCQEGKKRLANVLSQAKESRSRKKRRVEAVDSEELDSNQIVNGV